MKKYNLTFWQRLELPFLFFFWMFTPKEDRKTWHHVKKGMEKHICDFSVPITEYGPKYKVFRCSHEGCNMEDILD